MWRCGGDLKLSKAVVFIVNAGLRLYNHSVKSFKLYRVKPWDPKASQTIVGGFNKKGLLWVPSNTRTPAYVFHNMVGLELKYVEDFELGLRVLEYITL